MNLWLQIGIGLLPGTIVTLLLLFVRKAFDFRKIIFSLLLLAACGGTIGVGVRGLIADGVVGSQQLSQKNLISFANALAVEGAYDEAFEVIDEYSESYGYDDDCRLLAARINLLVGNYDKASGIYTYLCNNTKLISEDADEVVCAASNAVGFKLDDIKKAVKKAVNDSVSISDEIQDCAETVYLASVSYEEGQSEAGDDEEEKDAKSINKKLKRAFEKIEEECPELLLVDCVKKARIKAYVLNGDYDALVQKLDTNASYHELMVAAELYMSGLVKATDFSQAYQSVSNDAAEKVKDQVDKVYQSLRNEVSKKERNKLKDRVTAINNQVDDLVLVSVKERLTELNEEETGTDKTKVSLELAKIENYFGNETATDSYLSEAIYSSQDCEDDSYVAAMSQIINVISNDDVDDLENIKNVSDYVDAVLEHSLTVDVEKLIAPEEQEKEESASDPPDFAQTTVDYVSRARSAISIGRIDTTDFSKITARVQISSDHITDVDELKKALKVYDCGAEIKDFTLKKVNYSGSNIILVCDVSGSMDGSIQDLRDSVATFVNNRNENENLSVVTFSYSIEDTMPFGTSDEELISFAESMYANGGTDMYAAVLSCLGSFPDGGNTNNVLILMTDGQDNSPKSKETIYEELGELALEKGVTVYAMGLGLDVDTAYLSYIAGSGNGKFIYVSDSASLSAFYDMLHDQVDNQYELTYEAADTISMSGRTLEVALPEENIRDVKTYSLGTEEETEGDLKVTKDLSVSGISPRYAYKGLQDITVKLKGTGFKAESSVTVKLNGNIDYTLEAEYTDAETYTLKIPASVAVGNYNVEVTIDGKKKILQNGFSVITQGDEKKTVFGPYVFTSAEKIENSDGSLLLRGAVTMNNWLRFKGDITISGDVAQGGSVNVYDDSGSYVEFDPATAEGIGSFLAKKGISLDIPRLNGFTLYNDPQNGLDYEDYMVDDIYTGALTISNLLLLDSPTLRLYPDSIGLYFKTGTTILPWQDEILGDAADDLFEFSFDGSAQITNQNVETVLEVSYSAADNAKSIRTMNLLNSPVDFKGSFDLKIDTIEDEYEIGISVGMDFMDDDSEVSAKIGWKEQLIPDSVELGLELDKGIKLPTTFPIEVNNFAFKVANISSALESGNLIGLEYTGSMDLSSMKVKDYVPGMAKIFDDVSLLEMPETTATIQLWPPRVELDASLMFLSEIKLAEAGIKIGKFEYSNSLLNLDEADVAGLMARLKLGLMWNGLGDRVNVEISGEGELDAHTRFVGVDMTGTAAYDISWWILSSKKKEVGEFALGLYTTHDGKQQFIFTYRTQNSKGKTKGKFYYVDENGKCGKKNGTLS